MPKSAAAGGGNYLGTPGWLKLAEDNGVVLIFKHRQMEDFKGDEGNAVQIATDVLVLSPEKRAGEFWPGQNVINSAITSKLVDEPDGFAISAHVAQGKRGGRPYPMANPTSEPEWQLVEKAYADAGVDINAEDADAQLFAKLRKVHADAKRDEVRSATASVSASKGGSAADPDDEPPF